MGQINSNEKGLCLVPHTECRTYKKEIYDVLNNWVNICGTFCKLSCYYPTMDESLVMISDGPNKKGPVKWKIVQYMWETS